MSEHERLAERVEALGRYNCWHLRRVGAYGFFAVLSVSLAALGQILIAKSFGISIKHWFVDLVGVVVIVAAFMALRDMTRNPYQIVADAARAVGKSERQQ